MKDKWRELNDYLLNIGLKLKDLFLKNKHQDALDLLCEVFNYRREE